MTNPMLKHNPAPVELRQPTGKKHPVPNKNFSQNLQWIFVGVVLAVILLGWLVVQLARG